jgi:asparagine synthase (glutamine-hydrolysing)
MLFEISTRTARTFGIDARHPFTDRRLVEFCYALPPQQKVADGWTRNIVRRGLADILPEAIRQRGDKAENSRAVTKAFLTQDADRLETLIDHNVDRLAEFIDVPLLQSTYQRYRNTGNEQDEMLIWQVATLSSWLEQKESTPHMS